MKTTGLIDKYQYAHQRKGYERPPYKVGRYYSQNASYTIQNNSIQKPLNGGLYPQISFKGFDFSMLKNSLKPIVKPIPKKLTAKVYKSLKDIF